MFKVYLSLHEAEHLIFNKILIIPEQRLEIIRAQGSFSVAVLLEGKELFFNSNLSIFLSGVLKFEIAEEDKNIFLNHYRLPLGLLSLKRRKFREGESDKSALERVKHTGFMVDDYCSIRRAFINIYHQALKKGIDSESSKQLVKYLNSFDRLSEFQRRLISTVLLSKSFPVKRVAIKNKAFSSEEFYQWVWWGNFLVENLLSDETSDSKLKQHKSWLQLFDPDNKQSTGIDIDYIPEKFESHYPIIIGYYQAITAPIGSLDNSTFDLEYEITFWMLFFQSLFSGAVDFIYPTSVVQDEYYKLEVNAFELSKNIRATDIECMQHAISMGTSTDDNVIKSYLSLKNGVAKKDIKIISLSAIFDTFKESLLFGENRVRIGLILNSVHDMELPNNYIQVDGKSLSIHQNDYSQVIIYYGDIPTGMGVNVKVKPLSLVIKRTKKVLFGILNKSGFNELLDLYAYIFDKGEFTHIDKLTFIWEVDRESSQIHTVSFENEKSSLKNSLENMFGRKVDLFIKNRINDGDTEIKRLIKHSIGEYRLGEVEAIDNGFTEEHAKWLVESTYDCVIRDENADYTALYSK